MSDEEVDRIRARDAFKRWAAECGGIEKLQDKYRGRKMQKGSWEFSGDLRPCFPPVLRAISAEWLTELIPRQIVIPGWLCHSQPIERAVQMNNQASSRVKKAGEKRDKIASILVGKRLTYKSRKQFSLKVQEFSSK